MNEIIFKDIVESFNHYLDKTNKRDLIISVYEHNNYITLWDFTTLECYINMKIYIMIARYYLLAFHDNDQIYII